MSTSYWWVVQGGNYTEERDLGILWAPIRNKNGHRKAHWSSLERVSVGDVIIHYADVHVRAVSRVTHASIPAPKPFPSTEWVGEGWLVRTAYEELDTALHRDEIPIAIRLSQTHSNAPFFLKGGRVGHVNLGYLFDLTADAGAAIVDLIEGAIPRSKLAGAPRRGANNGRMRQEMDAANTSVPRRRAWKAPNHDDRVIHQSPTADAVDTERIVTYEEFKLQSAFGRWLAASETPAELLSLPTAGIMIEPDFHVPLRSWIVEAKKSEARPYVRLAIGQVLDYVAVADSHGIDARPVVLLPRRPAADLVALLARHRILLAVPSDEQPGHFDVLEP